MKTCLVVDDSSVIRKVARRILEGLDFQISEAEDGERALEAVQREMPDAILLDWNMPNMDGYEFLRALRRLPHGDAPKVVFCTTENDVAHIARALHAGANVEAVRPRHCRGQVPGSRPALNESISPRFLNSRRGQQGYKSMSLAAALPRSAPAPIRVMLVEVQRGLPIALLLKYFVQKEEQWQIVPEIRAMVQFRQLNLLSDFTHLGMFDIIFCRNVLIYFDRDTKARVLGRLSRVIEGDGYLVLGAAETVVGLSEAFRPLVNERGLYAPVARSSGRPPLRIVAAAS
jgi:two-component system chemotaxis response regulator CheY